MTFGQPTAGHLLCPNQGDGVQATKMVLDRERRRKRFRLLEKSTGWDQDASFRRHFLKMEIIIVHTHATIISFILIKASLYNLHRPLPLALSHVCILCVCNSSHLLLFRGIMQVCLIDHVLDSPNPVLFVIHRRYHNSEREMEVLCVEQGGVLLCK